MTRDLTEKSYGTVTGWPMRRSVITAVAAAAGDDEVVFAARDGDPMAGYESGVNRSEVKLV